MSIAWKSRARRETNWTAERRIWESRDGWFRVVHNVNKFGLPAVFYAERKDLVDGRTVWDVISRHRSKLRAFQACEKEYRRVERKRSA